MNQIRNDFNVDLKKFFIDLKNYLDTELYFYGSVNRSDYIHNKSDIDVAIFTDNEYSVMTKLQHYLHVNRDAFDKIVWKLEGTIVYGYKIKCDKHTNSKCEISIYNNKDKQDVLFEHNSKKDLPFYILWLLMIIKFFYYTLQIMSKSFYYKCKRFVMNYMVEGVDTEFVIIDGN